MKGISTLILLGTVIASVTSCAVSPQKFAQASRATSVESLLNTMMTTKQSGKYAYKRNLAFQELQMRSALSHDQAALIANSTPELGLNTDSTRLIFGQPNKISKLGGSQTDEQWTYSDIEDNFAVTHLHFKDGLVVKISH